jgi:hypothetical protein
MLIAAVAMAGLLGWSPDDKPVELVARLGSPRFAEREAAAESLKRLGDAALPALREARSARDPEIRIRATKLREEIEADTLLKHAGPLRVELLRIRRERDLDLTPGVSPFNRRARSSGPISSFAPPGHGPEVKEVRDSNVFAELLISAGPRVSIVGAVSIERLKASDAQGHSVLREPTEAERKAEIEMYRSNPQFDQRGHPEWRFGRGSGRSSPSELQRIALADSIPPGVRLAKLEGVIAVAVMGRRADPLVISLADANPRTVENDGVRVTVHEAAGRPNELYGELELTLETERPAETLRVQGPGIAPVEIPRPFDLIEREIEILDTNDKLIAWSFLQPPPGGLRGRMRLQVRPHNQGERLDFSGLRLSVSTMVGAATEFPFSFADIPMP